MKRYVSIKGICVLILAALMSISLCGCCLQHDWVSATCVEPETCSKCGKTRGESLGHDWQPATCTEPKICSVCGTVSGEPLEHNYEASGEKFLCTRCGKERVFSYLDMNDVLYGIEEDYAAFKKMYMDMSMVMQISVTDKNRTGALTDHSITLRTIQNPNNKSEYIDVHIVYEPKTEADAAAFKNIDNFSYVTIRATLNDVLSGFFDNQYIIYFNNGELISEDWESN